MGMSDRRRGHPTTGTAASIVDVALRSKLRVAAGQDPVRHRRFGVSRPAPRQRTGERRLGDHRPVVDVARPAQPRCGPRHGATTGGRPPSPTSPTARAIGARSSMPVATSPRRQRPARHASCTCRSDVVFPGRPTPYVETDEPFAAQRLRHATRSTPSDAVTEVCPDAVMIRTSLLYGTDGVGPAATGCRRRDQRPQRRSRSSPTRCAARHMSTMSPRRSRSSRRCATSPVRCTSPDPMR